MDAVKCDKTMCTLRSCSDCYPRKQSDDDKLVEFFRHEGSEYGARGDAEGWTPAECAIAVIRELSFAKRKATLDGAQLNIPGTVPLTILEEAGLLVNQGGDRNDSYDHPYHNFSKIASVAAIVFGIPVTPRQVGLFMIGMKLVRDSHKAKRDNIVDIAGYARCIERLEEWEKRPEATPN